MDIFKYGVALKKLSAEHLELLRKHRNSDAIRKNMFYQEIISEEAQLAWFNSINNIYNFYFLIYHNNEIVGLISGKKIDYTSYTSEGGIFIWNDNYKGTIIPSIASLIMAELTFSLLKFNATIAEVRNDNTRQIKYNKLMGYELTKAVDEKLIFTLTSEKFFNKTQKLIKSIGNFDKEKSSLTWENVDFSNSNKEHLAKMFQLLKPEVKKEISPYLPINV